MTFVGTPQTFWCSDHPCCWIADIVVCVWLTPRHCKIFFIRRDSKLCPCSLCSSCGTQKWQKNLITSASALAKASCLEMVLASRHLVKWSKPIRRGIGFLGHSLGRVLPHSWLPFEWCRTTGTTSQHHFLHGASSTFTGPYLGYCWHPSDILTVHHVVWSAHHSLCSKEELSGQFLIICLRIPGTLAYCSSQWRTSIGPTSFSTWGCGWYLVTQHKVSRSLAHVKKYIKRRKTDQSFFIWYFYLITVKWFCFV
jgi:hypothetical protein